MTKRPENVDLRTKMSRPNDELDFLYAEEKKMSGNKTKSLMSLIKVEEYFIYLEKKLKVMEKKVEQVQREVEGKA